MSYDARRENLRAIAEANQHFYGPEPVPFFRVCVQERVIGCGDDEENEVVSHWEEPYARWGDAVARWGEVNHGNRVGSGAFATADILWPQGQLPGPRGFYDPKFPLPIFGKSEHERANDWAMKDDRFGRFIDWYAEHEELADLIDHEMAPEDCNYQDVCDLLGGSYRDGFSPEAELNPSCPCRCEHHGRSAVVVDDDEGIDDDDDDDDDIEYASCACRPAHFLDIDLADLQGFRAEAEWLFEIFCETLSLTGRPHRCHHASPSVRREDGHVRAAQMAGVAAMHNRVTQARARFAAGGASDGKFTKDHIKDAKRLVRAEHYLQAQRLLRSRDFSRTEPWSVLTLAGGSPEEEIGTIQTLMPRAKVVAVDRDAVCVAKALAAGATDGVIVQDVLQTEKARHVPEAISRFGKFDIVNLDMCCTPTVELRQAVAAYGHAAVTPRGVLMVTFSYGHDVVEHFVAHARGGSLFGQPMARVVRLMEDGFSESLIGRVIFLSERASHLSLRSVVAYQGNRMPMCALLFEKRRGHEWLGQEGAWIRIGDEDLEHAVLEGASVDKLYGAPSERILEMRRRAAARKAVATRRAKKILPSNGVGA